MSVAPIVKSLANTCRTGRSRERCPWGRRASSTPPQRLRSGPAGPPHDLTEAGIPHVNFKYAENSGQMQPIREQAGTFADSIKLWS